MSDFDSKNFTPVDEAGNVIKNTTVTVLLAGTGTLATELEDGDGNALTNPFDVTSEFGDYALALPDGIYDIAMASQDGRTRLFRNVSYIAVQTGAVVALRADLASGDDGKGAEQVAFKQKAIGSVVRTVADTLRERVSVMSFGAIADGDSHPLSERFATLGAAKAVYPHAMSLDDEIDWAATQAAVNAVGAKGGGIVIMPFGVYVIPLPVNAQFSNLRIVGDSVIIVATDLVYDTASMGSGAVFRFTTPHETYSTTLAVSAEAGDAVLTLTSAANAKVGDFIRCISDRVQYSNDGTNAYFNDQNKIVAINGNEVTLETPLSYDLDVTSNTVSVIYVTMIKNIKVSGIEAIGGGVMEPLVNGLGQCGIWARGVSNYTIDDCKFYGFQGFASCLDAGLDHFVNDCYAEGIDPDEVIVEGANSGFYGFSVYRCRRVLFTKSTGVRVRHMYDAQECYGIVQSSSIATKTHRGAFGSHEEVYDLVVNGNISNACYAGGVVRALTAGFSANDFRQCQNAAITTAVMLATESPGRLSITGNYGLDSVLGTTGAVRINGIYDRLLIADNPISGMGVGILFECEKIKNAFVMDNFVDAPVGLEVRYPATSLEEVDGLVINTNGFTNYTGNMVVLRGAENPSLPADRIIVDGNVGFPSPNASGPGVRFRSEGYYGENIVIGRNTQWGDPSATIDICSTPSSQLYRMKAYPVIEQNNEHLKTAQGNRSVGYFASGTAPSNATLLRGGRLERVNPASGAPDHWVVTSSGTEGSITGVTGSVASGSTTLALSGNDATKAYSGSYINIAGAGAAGATLSVRIIAISDDFATATLETAAATTVSGASVTRKNPTITAAANLA